MPSRASAPGRWGEPGHDTGMGRRWVLESPDGCWSFRFSAGVCGVMTEEQVLSTDSTRVQLASPKETESIWEAKLSVLLVVAQIFLSLRWPLTLDAPNVGDFQHETILTFEWHFSLEELSLCADNDVLSLCKYGNKTWIYQAQKETCSKLFNICITLSSKL